MTPPEGLTLRAGRVDITPTTPLALFGRTGRADPFDQVASRLEANCLLIGRADDLAAIVSLDTLYPSQTLSDAIYEATARNGLILPQDALILVASHTHNAPALDDTKPKLGPCDPAYVAFVAEQIAACLVSLSSENPTGETLSNGHATCSAAVFRRRRVPGMDLSRLRVSKRCVMAPNPRVEIDETLKLIMLRDTKGAAKAVLWTWPCHAVSEPDANTISADFPGALRAHIREALGDALLPVLYFPGFSADIRPASSSALPIHKSGSWVGIGPRFGKRSTDNASALNRALRQTFDQALATMANLGDLPGMTLDRQRRTLALHDVRTPPQDVAPLTCDDWRIGPLTIKAASAEIASGYSAMCGGQDPLTFLTGCAGQTFGYIPMDDQIPEGGYEVSGFAPAFTVSGAFQAKIEDKISDLIGK